MALRLSQPLISASSEPAFFPTFLPMSALALTTYHLLISGRPLEMLPHLGNFCWLCSFFFQKPGKAS